MSPTHLWKSCFINRDTTGARQQELPFPSHFKDDGSEESSVQWACRRMACDFMTQMDHLPWRKRVLTNPCENSRNVIMLIWLLVSSHYGIESRRFWRRVLLKWIGKSLNMLTNGSGDLWRCWTDHRRVKQSKNKETKWLPWWRLCRVTWPDRFTTLTVTSCSFWFLESYGCGNHVLYKVFRPNFIVFFGFF